MRPIDADDFTSRMYREVFEKDSDMIKWDSGCWIRYKLFEKMLKAQPAIESSAQPDRLTDDDFETIRIHLNAYKEKLCNQHRWKEAEEYQHILDRFMVFESAHSEIRCKECKHWHREIQNGIEYFNYSLCDLKHGGDGHNFYCADAERKEGKSG